MAQANKTLNRSKMGRKYRKNEGGSMEGDKSMKKAQKEDKHNNSNTTNYG